MKNLFKLVLLCAYQILIHGTPYENQLAEDIKLSRLADHALLQIDESAIDLQGIKSHTKTENCNQTFYSTIQYKQNNEYKFNQISSLKDAIISQPKLHKIQESTPTTRLDSKLKSTLENHFTETIDPDHECFYKWLYHALDNGTENLWLKNEEWRKDFHFSPSDDLTSTPFPIPSKHQALYEWISYQIANVTETTHGKRVKRVKRNIHVTLDSAFKSILEKHFTETIQQQFEPFYKWLYHNLDDGKVDIHKKNADWIVDPNFAPCEEDFLPNTPFPIPLRHQALYEYISQQAANTKATPQVSRKRMKRDLGTTPMPEHTQGDNQDDLKQKLEQHFTEAIEPQHLEFYHWLYKKLDNGKVNIYQKIKEYMYDYFFTVAPVLTNTPFPIPFKHWALYEWIAEPRVSNIPRSSPKPTTPTPTTDLWKEFRSYFTNDADYKDKYNKFSNWYQEAVKNTPASEDKDLLKANVIDQAFLNSDSHEHTIFPIPSAYHSWYHWLRSFKSSTAPKPTYDPLDEKSKHQLENYFNETIAPHYAPFYKWLYKELDNGQAHMYRKVGEWIADPDFYPSDPLTNKPFPIPYKHQPLYEYIMYKKANYTKGPRPTIDSKFLYDFI